jgi:hypothetical protein
MPYSISIKPLPSDVELLNAISSLHPNLSLPFKLSFGSTMISMMSLIPTKADLKGFESGIISSLHCRRLICSYPSRSKDAGIKTQRSTNNDATNCNRAGVGDLVEN